MSRANRTYGDVEWWLPYPEFPAYLVSSHGRVKNRDGSIKAQVPIKEGFSAGRLIVGFWTGERTVTRLINRVICTTFHGGVPSSIHQAAHNDGDFLNNHKDNLRWATPKENSADKYEHGTHIQGEDSPWAKLTKADVVEIRHAPRGTPLRSLAKKFGVSKNHIAKIRTRSRGIWPDVPFLEKGGRHA